MIEKVIAFTKTFIKNGDTIVLYFSGHGGQYEGNNYLIPTNDTTIGSDQDIEVFGVNIKRIIDRLTESKTECVLLLILDCCRPYTLGGATGRTREFSYSYDFAEHLYVFV
jgi:uncharacterized caspase-like protein